MPVFVTPESAEPKTVFDWLRRRRQPTPEQYFQAMAILEWFWQQAVPGLSLKVVHDKPDHLPKKSTRAAMGVFAALLENSTARTWFAHHIRNAVMHSASAADAISVVGDSIHFYEAKKFAEDLGARLFDQLSSGQKEDLAQLYAGRDPRQEFAALMNTHPDEDRFWPLYEQASQSLPARDFELLVAKLIEVRQSARGTGASNGEWSNEMNNRRVELIDKDIQGSITPEERIELAELQRKAVDYRDRVAPLPIEGARRLHEQLLNKNRQQDGS
jgi:hypothetical protein